MTNRTFYSKSPESFCQITSHSLASLLNKALYEKSFIVIYKKEPRRKSFVKLVKERMLGNCLEKDAKGGLKGLRRSKEYK